jgi:hypothetical protein
MRRSGCTGLHAKGRMYRIVGEGSDVEGLGLVGLDGKVPI